MAKLKNLFVAHQGNAYHPHLFRRSAVAVLILVVILFEGAYLFDTQIAQNHEGFLASVLPGALLDLTNSDRASIGVAPLQNDPLLARAAQLKANDMAAKSYFAHMSPEGKTPWYWLDTVGYQYTYAGENLAINFDDSNAVEAAWMNSPTHRANIVKAQYTRVGYAVAQGTFEGKPTTFVVQEFATKPTDETVTITPKSPNLVSSAVQKIVSAVKPATQEQPETVAVSRATAKSPENTKPEVAGAEVSASPKQASPPMILGTHTGQTTASHSTLSAFFAHLAASPLSTSIYILGGLSIILLLLLGLALVSHAQVRHLEVLSGGLIVIIFALSVLTYNMIHTPAPVLPGSAAAFTAGP